MSKHTPERPDKAAILRVIADAHTPLTKRDIVSAFGIRGDDRRDIKDLLRELEDEGLIVKTAARNTPCPKGCPPSL